MCVCVSIYIHLCICNLFTNNMAKYTWAEIFNTLYEK